MKRIAVGISGGVDSAVAAALLKKRGFDIAGVTLRLTGSEAVGDAAAVCRALNIEHFLIDLRTQFERLVITPFIDAYKRGSTPNPCVVCNKQIKFGLMLDWVKNNGFDAIATGHYLGIAETNGRAALVKARSVRRDQSYFLCMLGQQQLRSSVFPLAGYEKDEVREMAADFGLPVASKPDSQDICFVGHEGYAAVLEKAVGLSRPGPIIDCRTGGRLGSHKGLEFYTVGQRKGLGGLDGKRYVVRLDPASNAVVVGSDADLYSDVLTACNANWMASDEPPGAIRATGKIRSGASETACTVTPLPENRIAVKFDEPVRAATSGQTIALYSNAMVLAGGVIE